MAIQYQKYYSSVGEWFNINTVLEAPMAPQHGIISFNTETDRDQYFSIYPQYLTYNLIVILLGTSRALKFNAAVNSQYLPVI